MIIAAFSTAAKIRNQPALRQKKKKKWVERGALIQYIATEFNLTFKTTEILYLAKVKIISDKAPWNKTSLRRCLNLM